MQDRVLAIDYGEKRIGLALSDPLWLTAQPLSFLENNKIFFVELQKIIQEYDVKKIVLGLPKNLQGHDTAKTLEVRTFAEKLQKNLSMEVVFWDERFSTVAVNKFLIGADVSRKKRKKVVDSQAAAFFLQGYMDRYRQ
ncbi:Holliday junction resolvase RuvX [bacterium]|nr:Holliday junction resolvase RuvX [bacterium]MBT4552616.1 Holliday junction resolvase RuvX [bacterium]